MQFRRKDGAEGALMASTALHNRGALLVAAIHAARGGTMLTIYYKATHALRRLRGSSAGAFMDEYAQRLHDAGYAWNTARERLRTAAHMSRWFDTHGPRIRHWDEAA